MKRVPIAKYLSTHRKETNLHQSDIQAATVTSGIFEPASAHHPFNKNNTQIKKVYTSIFNSGSSQRRRSRFVSSEIPLAVTTGAERVSAFKELPPCETLLNNTPLNVQRQRHMQFEQVSASCNSALHKMAGNSLNAFDRSDLMNQASAMD